MRVVAQQPETKVGGVTKLPPQVAEPPQPQIGSPAQLPQDVAARCTPTTLPADCASTGLQPPLPVLKWLHLSLGGPSPLPLLPPEASEPALCPSWPGVAALPVWWAPYPKPSSWWPALARPPGHLNHWPKFQLL